MSPLRRLPTPSSPTPRPHGSDLPLDPVCSVSTGLRGPGPNPVRPSRDDSYQWIVQWVVPSPVSAVRVHVRRPVGSGGPLESFYRLKVTHHNSLWVGGTHRFPKGRGPRSTGCFAGVSEQPGAGPKDRGASCDKGGVVEGHGTELRIPDHRVPPVTSLVTPVVSLCPPDSQGVYR